MIDEIIKSVKGFFGKNLITKEWLNDAELSEARKNKCITCPKYIIGKDECSKCGCLISVKMLAKVNINVKNAHYEETHCPEGFWPIRLEDGNIGGNDLAIRDYYKNEEYKRF